MTASAALRRVAVRGVLGVVLGGALGAWLAEARGGPFVAPHTLNDARWKVIVPGRNESIVDMRGRGTGITGGVMELVPHVFSRADMVVQRSPTPIARADITLAEDSGPLRLRLRDGPTLLKVDLAPGRSRLDAGEWRAHDTDSLTILVADGVVRLGDVRIGLAPAPTVEISAIDEPVRIRRITLTAADGTVVLDENPGPAWRESAPVVPGALLGAAVGALAAVGGWMGLVAAALPLGVLFAPTGTWLWLIETFRLVRASPWELATLVLLLTCVPVVGQALAASGRALPGGGAAERDPSPIWLAAPLVTAAFASRDATMATAVLLPFGLGFLYLPVFFARATRLDLRGVLLRDLPAHALVGALGWGVGLLPALAWRLVVLIAGAGTLLRRSPRVASDALFLGTLALVPAAELAARSTWLDVAWDAAHLSGEAWMDPTPFWEDTCGSGPGASVLYVGGSSTGGAYQFGGNGALFFPARVHEALCASGRALHTRNTGRGGRDSFTASRSIDALIAAHTPKVVVAYLGVNDLLTRESTLTRAQREALEHARSPAQRALDALAGRSRLVTGLGLLGRPAVDLDAKEVPDVPLPDAEVNLRRIAAATHAAGARLVLAPEFTAPEKAPELAPYAAMMARLGGELPGVVYVDVYGALAPYAAEGLLFDRNHLSHAGTARLAEVLAPVVAGLLTGPAPSPPPAASAAAPPAP